MPEHAKSISSIVGKNGGNVQKTEIWKFQKPVTQISLKIFVKMLAYCA